MGGSSATLRDAIRKLWLRRSSKAAASMGNNAGPVVRDIVKAYYDKKSGQKDQRYTTKITRPEILPASANSPTLANGQPGLGPDAGRTGPESAKPKATR